MQFSILLTSLLIVGVGCKLPQSKGDLQRNKGSDERIGDQGEGLAGYLTKPDLVEIQTSDLATSITAPAGSVEAYEKGNVTKIPVGAWSLVHPIELDGSKLRAENLGCFRAKPDGSLEIEVEAAKGEDLFVTVGKNCDSNFVDTAKDEFGNLTHTSLYLKHCPELYTAKTDTQCTFEHNGEIYGGAVSTPVNEADFIEHMKAHPEVYIGSDLEKDLVQDGVIGEDWYKKND